MPRTLALTTLLALTALARAQDGGAPAGQHWAVTLGTRVEMVDRAFPVVDTVVLVPDAATYVDELGRWSPRGRWPVLIEDDRFAPMFIRRFDPARVVRRDSVGNLPRSAEDRRTQLESVVVRTWGGDPHADGWRDAFARHGFAPPGVVITSVDDPAWTAAVALAAGRGQPLAWLDTDFGRPNETLSIDKVFELRGTVIELVAAAGYDYDRLGDAIDTVTLCRAVAGRAEVAPAGGETRATTDLVGRAGGDRRWAFAGWIFGDEARCAYAAMCSLFLDRSHFLLYNTYDEPEVLAAFGFDDAAPLLAARGFRVETVDAAHATKQAWLGGLPGGMTADVLLMQTSGNSTVFHLADDRASARDVPILDVPLALHFTHSYSLKTPDNDGTVGGRWLARGVYAYLGSVDEPTLAGFIPPRFFIQRCANLVPFLIAGRKWDDSAPWKINTIGDPLMICRPPILERPARVQREAADGTDLRERAKSLMREAAGDESGETLAEALALVVLLGEDGIAADLWTLANQKGVASAAAPAALGPLFRLRRTDDFLRAWIEVADHDETTVDMLWHLMTPRLDSADPDVLLELEGVIRADQAEADLKRLVPHLTAAFGAAHAQAAVQRQVERTRNPRARRRLRDLTP